MWCMPKWWFIDQTHDHIHKSQPFCCGNLWGFHLKPGWTGFFLPRGRAKEVRNGGRRPEPEALLRSSSPDLGFLMEKAPKSWKFYRFLLFGQAIWILDDTQKYQASSFRPLIFLRFMECLGWKLEWLQGLSNLLLGWLSTHIHYISTKSEDIKE